MADDRIAHVLFSKNRQSILALLFGHSDETFYLRQIARAVGGLGAVQRELRQLTEAGILRRSVQGKQVYFQANPDCSIFSELKSLMSKTAGAADVLRSALAPLADRISLALIYGSMARSEENLASDVDLLVVGGTTFGEIVSALAPAQETLQREINPTVYPVEEFRAKLKLRHYFLSTVIAGAKIFVIGDEHELERLVEERVAH
jgi:uncharacterized protein